MNKKPKITIIGSELQDLIKSVSPQATAAFKRKPYCSTAFKINKAKITKEKSNPKETRR